MIEHVNRVQRICINSTTTSSDREPSEACQPLKPVADEPFTDKKFGQGVPPVINTDENVGKKLNIIV